MVFYVDNILILYLKEYKKNGLWVIERILEVYKIYDEGDILWFLGIRVVKNRIAKKVYFVYNLYIDKIVKRFDLVNETIRFPSILILATRFKKFEGVIIKVQVKAYQERMGLLLYMA